MGREQEFQLGPARARRGRDAAGPPNDISIARTVNLGNIELEAEYEKELNEQVEIFSAAHVALPTSSGNELPSEATLASDPASVNPVAQTSSPPTKPSRARTAPRTPRCGSPAISALVPAASISFRFGPVRIEPYVKLESMFSVRPESAERAIVELDVGGRFAVEVVKFPKHAESETALSVGVRAWGSFTLTDHEGDLNIGVVEPEVRVGGEKWRVTAGVLVPFAGELTDPQWISGRLSATMLF